MKEELIKYTCDECEETITRPKHMYNGLLMNAKWIRMDVRVKPLDMQKTQLHFCGKKCCAKFLLTSEQT